MLAALSYALVVCGSLCAALAASLLAPLPSRATNLGRAAANSQSAISTINYLVMMIWLVLAGVSSGLPAASTIAFAVMVVATLPSKIKNWLRDRAAFRDLNIVGRFSLALDAVLLVAELALIAVNDTFAMLATAALT